MNSSFVEKKRSHNEAFGTSSLKFYNQDGEIASNAASLELPKDPSQPEKRQKIEEKEVELQQKPQQLVSMLRNIHIEPEEQALISEFEKVLQYPAGNQHEPGDLNLDLAAQAFIELITQKENEKLKEENREMKQQIKSLKQNNALLVTQRENAEKQVENGQKTIQQMTKENIEREIKHK